MNVRLVAPREWARYRTFRLRALAEDPAAFGRTHAEESALPDEEWEKRLARAGFATFVAEGAQAWMGTASVGLDGSPEIFGMWVAPEARGQGAGLAILAACATWARERGAEHLGLWVNVAQEPAVRLYRRAGFAPDGPPQPGTRDSSRVFQRMTRAL